LLLAPLANAYANGNTLASVLNALTVEDASEVYQAIRIAEPGGLGQVDSQDVRSEPTVTLLEAMRMAADRDLVARQYATEYADVLGMALPALRDGLGDGLSLEQAIIRTHVTVLSQNLDTLILRKQGRVVAENVRLVASRAIVSGNFDELDRFLRNKTLNPGATADLIAATLFAALAEDTMTLPVVSGPLGWTGSA
jgi:triphosphoribosyl-dephospho-CoA synthase